MPTDALPTQTGSEQRAGALGLSPTRAAVPVVGSPLPADSHSQRFRFVDALRGIAALGVAWHHINLYGPLPDAAATVMPAPLHWAWYYGWAGVPVFFVISGFVIAYSVRDAWITPRFLGNFALRRSLRLDPSYWAMIGLALLLHFLPELAGLPSPHETGLSTGQVLSHFVYLQNISEYDNLSAGFWTLCIEMQFYLLFCAMLGIAHRLSRADASRPHARGSMLVVVYLPLALASLYLFNLNEAYDDWIVYFFSMFFLGSLAWWTLDCRISDWWFWGYVAAMAARLGFFGGDDLPVAIATGGAIFLVGRAGRLTSWLNWRPLQYLGRISYSLYLIHYPVSHIVISAGHRLTGDAPLASCGWLALAVVLSMLAAHFLYLFVEAPTARLAARLKPRSGGGAQPLAGVDPAAIDGASGDGVSSDPSPQYNPSPAGA
jgi:peptidoglycan/LPS O-acetylase OafA/YrhL